MWKNGHGGRRHHAKQNHIDRQIEQCTMPDETIDAAGIQEPLDHKLEHKSNCGKNRKSRKIHAIDIELANHRMLHHLTLTASTGVTCGAAGDICIG